VGIRSPILANDVPKKQLDSMLRKKYGEKPAQKIAKNMSFLGT
jgi:hypothetical protein